MSVLSVLSQSAASYSLLSSLALYVLCSSGVTLLLGRAACRRSLEQSTWVRSAQPLYWPLGFTRFGLG